MIRTWAADITPLLDEECYRRYYQEVPEPRQKKADRIRKREGRAQSIGVWILYAKMQQFYKLNGWEACNFSHSGSYVLCSVCTDQEEAAVQTRVGCDVEKAGKCRFQLAERFFCQSEYQYIAKETGEKQKEAFYRYWVLKESFIKATGKGLALGLNTFEIRLGNPSVLTRQPEEYRESYFYMESELGDGAYRVAVCSTDAEIDPEIRVIQLRYNDEHR